jgi:hypothetical protein
MSIENKLNIELDFQSLFGLLWTAVLIETETPQPPPPRILAHILERYWSAQVDDNSL